MILSILDSLGKIPNISLITFLGDIVVESSIGLGTVVGASFLNVLLATGLVAIVAPAVGQTTFID